VLQNPNASEEEKKEFLKQQNDRLRNALEMKEVRGDLETEMNKYVGNHYSINY
jgi:hypothetical protein